MDLRTLPTLHTQRSLSLPLRGGPLSQRLLLRQAYSAVAAAAAAAGGQHRPQQQYQVVRKGLFGDEVEPSVAICLSPVPTAGVPAAALLPAAAVASPALAQVVGLYRLLLAEALPASEVGALARGAGSESQQQGVRTAKH